MKYTKKFTIYTNIFVLKSVHFTRYLNSTNNSRLDKNQFIKIGQNDNFLLKPKCMAECKDILKKVFYILDGNFDDWFNLEDLDQLDELALADLNKKISKMTERFNKLNEKHLENINKVCTDWNTLY